MSQGKTPARETPRLGGKVRALRRGQGMTQAQLAERLSISPSYLNLIESNHRPLPAPLLIKLAQLFSVELSSFASDEEARVNADLLEVFADPIFEPFELSNTDVREASGSSPQIARAIVALYRAYEAARDSADTLASKLSEHDDLSTVDRSRLPSEEVSDLIQRRMNYFAELEEGAEALWRDAQLSDDELYTPLVQYLERRLGVSVQVARGSSERGILRRYDPKQRQLMLSELLPTRSRTFQLAHQIGLLTQARALDSLVADPRLSTDESRALGRVALANYFASAVVMPYERFFQTAREERYDIDVIGRRFRVGFEQVCHRLTTLRRPGAQGIPFHMIRIDVAGNISKRFSASGIRFARFSGACPRWNVFAAFLTPGLIRLQLSRMPDGNTYFCLARTIQKDSGGYHAQQPVQAIGLGCQVQHAREMVYSDGVDLDNLSTATPVGVTCRLCEREDCEQRAFPSIRSPLRIDENQRGVSLYASTPPPRSK